MMISIRRFLYVAPFFSLPIMLTFESGLIVYFCSASFNLVLFNKIFESEFIKKRYNIPNLIDGTILDRMVFYLNKN
jgi:hypothetical protein